MIRVVSGTPRSARTNACSNSSQSIGLPANCWASASKNFMSEPDWHLLDRIYGTQRIWKQTLSILSSESRNPVNPVLLSEKKRLLPAPAASNLFGRDRGCRSQNHRIRRRQKFLPVQSLR